MAIKHILSLALESQSNSRRDSEPPKLLLCTTIPKSYKEGQPLPDLKIEATDNISIFVGHIYSSRLSKLLTRDANCTVSQFEAMLSHTLLQEPLPPSLSETERQELSNVILVAIPQDKGVKLRFQRDVGNVQKYLAEISLFVDSKGEADPDITEWAHVAVKHGSHTEREIRGLRAKLAAAEAGNGEIKKLVSELRREKDVEMEELMEKMLLLLDSKKARIRELELEVGRGGRPWPMVDVKSEDEAESKDSVGARGGRGRGRGGGRAKVTAGPSRAAKRKADEAAPEQNAEDVETEDEEETRLRVEEEDAGMETDRESLEELPVEQDGMEEDPDDLDSQHVTRNGGQKQARPAARKSPKISEQKQHAIREKQREEVVDEDASTDDEL